MLISTNTAQSATAPIHHHHHHVTLHHLLLAQPSAEHVLCLRPLHITYQKSDGRLAQVGETVIRCLRTRTTETRLSPFRRVRTASTCCSTRGVAMQRARGRPRIIFRIPSHRLRFLVRVISAEQSMCKVT